MDIKNKIQQHINLAQLTTLRIGGPAKLYVLVSSNEELVAAIKWARESGEKYFIMGGGSNLLVGDKGFDGLVIHYRGGKTEWNGEKVTAEAGVALAELVMEAANRGITGLEWAAGIPGTLGGAIRGNSGAHGASMQAVVESVTVFDPNLHETFIWKPELCKFGYRHSIFKESEFVILAATLAMKKGVEKDIRATMLAYMRRRTEMHPKEPNAGSIFKNVLLNELRRTHAELAVQAEQDNVVIGSKVSAGWIVTHLGLKGKEVGGAMVSYEHGNYIVNRKNATAEDILVLISIIKQKARVDYGIQLENEIQYLDY